MDEPFKDECPEGCNLCLYGLIWTTPRRIVPSGQHLQDLEGQIHAETTSRLPHQSEEAWRANLPRQTHPEVCIGAASAACQVTFDL